MSILCWGKDTAQICSIVQSLNAQFKIISKVRDEDWLLAEWIDHHLAIVEDKCIIIFDNMSSNAETFRIYNRYSDKVHVFQFAEMHNLLHNTTAFADLYYALNASASYYTFLDVDEFLFWNLDGSRLIANSSLIDLVSKCGLPVLPGIWIENSTGDRDGFLYTFRQNRIAAGVKGGKPIISANADISGFINHNIQLDRKLFVDCNTANIVIHHRKNLSHEQRVRANLNKLKSYNRQTRELERFGLKSDCFSLVDVLALDEENMPTGNSRVYIREIRELSTLAGKAMLTPNPIGLARLVDGVLIYSDPDDEASIRNFIRDPADVLNSILGAEC